MVCKKKSTLRVLLVEDHMIVRQGLRALLEGQEDIEVVAEAADGFEGVQKVEEHKPDVVVMDLAMPRLNGVDATKQLLKIHPDAKVLILSMHAGEEYVRPVLRAGASGFLLKGSGLSDLVKAIRAIAEGEAFFSPAVAKILLKDAQSGTQTTHKKQKGELTHREREILQLLAEGYSGPQIPETLHISSKTVESHRGRMMKKLDIHNLAGLVRYAIRIGLVSSDM